MGVLSYKTALATVQDALLLTIRLGLARRIVVADVTALKAVRSAAVLDGALYFVTATAAVYRFSRSSRASSAPPSVLVPTDAPAAGRWLLTSTGILDSTGTALSSSSSGYLRRVMLWSGEQTDKVWRERILGQRPAVVLQYSGETKENQANQRGCLAVKVYHFSVWGVSQNLRPDLEAERGSPVSTEAAADPGVAAIMGDLEYLLDGLTGSDLGVDGVDFLALDAAQPGVEDYNGREYVWTAHLDVRVTAGKEDPVRTALASLRVQAQDVQLRGASAWDADNYVESGLTIAVGGSLTQAPSDGSAVVAGTTVTVSGATAHPFTPSRVTYRDLSAAGVWTYVEAYTEDVEPAVTSGCLRVGVTTTNFSTITEDRILAPSAVDVGPDNQITP